MGNHLIGRPIGPSYVPGTLQGQSSANAPVSNPAQNARQKLWPAPQNPVPQNPASIKVAGQPQAASAIGRAQNTGFRRFSE